MSTLSGGPNVVVDGLILWLDAANTKSYVNGSTAWNDISRSGNNGTLVNGPTFNSGNGGSIAFDGIDDFANYGSVLRNLQEFSYNLWVNFTSGGAILSENGSSFTGVILWGPGIAGGTSIICQFGDGTNDSFFNSRATITLNTWINISFTLLNKAGKIYINGSLVNTWTNSSDITWARVISEGTTFKLGCRETTTSFGNMRLANLQVYNRALSQAEITQNYNSLKSRFNLT